MEALRDIASVVQPISVIVGFVVTVLGVPVAFWRLRAWMVKTFGAAATATAAADAAAASSETAAAAAKSAAVKAGTAAEKSGTAAQQAAATTAKTDELERVLLYIAEQLGDANRTVAGLRDTADDAFARLLEQQNARRRGETHTSRLTRIEEHLAENEAVAAALRTADVPLRTPTQETHAAHPDR